MPVAEVLRYELADSNRSQGIEKIGEKLLNRKMPCRADYFAAEDVLTLSPKQLGEVLFDRWASVGKKDKNGLFGQTPKTLEKLRRQANNRGYLTTFQVAKLRSTTEPYQVADADDRVHTKFKQTGTATEGFRRPSRTFNIRKDELGKIRPILCRKTPIIFSLMPIIHNKLRILAYFRRQKYEEAFARGRYTHLDAATCSL